MRGRGIVRWAALALVVPATCAACAQVAQAARAATAEEKDQRPVAGKCLTADGTVFERPDPARPWRVVDKGEAIHAGGVVMGLPGSGFDSADGAIRLTFLTNLNKDSPYPILDSAVVLHPCKSAPEGIDLDFTFDRGRIDVTNLKESGSARIRVHFHQEVWDATLEQPGTRIALMLYGRWVPGTHFKTDPGPRDVPLADLLLLVRKGSVRLRHGDNEHLMTAPPGPALIHWDNQGGQAFPEKLESLPSWAVEEEALSERAKKKQRMLEHFRKLAVDKTPAGAVQAFLQSDDRDERAIAVVFLGATDNLKGIAEALSQTRHQDVWDRAVQVTRHWLGRGPGQDLKLYNRLIKDLAYTPVEAETLLQLFHSFDEVQLSLPETYQMLIQYLGHNKMGIRGLAHWHLVRLVPDGMKIPYNPNADKEARDKARAEWKKLVPQGTVPPKPKPEPPPMPKSEKP